MKSKYYQILFQSIILIFFLRNEVTANTNDSCAPILAHIVVAEGKVEMRQTKDSPMKEIQRDQSVCLENQVRTRIEAKAIIGLRKGGKYFSVSEESLVEITKPEKHKDFFSLLALSGATYVASLDEIKLFIAQTENAIIAPTGTEFLIKIDKNTNDTTITVFNGSLEISNDYDRESFPLSGYGKTVVVRKNQKPRDEKVKSLRDVQWMLHYPTIIGHHQDGPYKELLEEAEKSLSIKRVEEAEAKITLVLKSDPNNSEAIALQSIIALVQHNDKEFALTLAKEAVSSNRESVPAVLALAYALQSQYKLDEALNVVKESRLAEKNALLLAQRAELRMAVGELQLAVEDAEKAVNLEPKNPRTLTVRGFAYLLEMDTTRAKDSFAAAIELDQASPMPRLGKGLALIREGTLEEGRIEIEIAVVLDPSNSLLRSYLGKAYFEEKRYPLATKQFEMAKKLDPQDPTPWLYDAIQKQTQNRPVEALQDIEKSIELNDNRAVYRSRLLLDQDQAGRGSSLARIYDNLGFEKRALMETAKSLSYDPASHSAHRFLSDAYTNIPRHEIARVSELLQAQLLQPINVNPVQPHLAVADLNIIANTGPAVAGFNEFTPLFERNKPQLVASGIAGSNNTIGNEVVASMLYDRASISVGQFHYETQGFRKNNDETHNIYNAFMQYAVTPKFNIQTELRTRKTEHGDLLLDFDTEKFREGKRRKIDEDVARIGARYAFSSNQDLLVSAKYVDRLESNKLNNDLNNAGFQVEAQHLFREKYFNSATGGGFYNFSWDDKIKRSPQFEFDEIKRENFYTYTNTNFPGNLNTTLGLSYDSFTSSVDGNRADKINPKFGLQWDILNSLRLRFAWFETAKSHLIAQQSLEPTQVAGFSQFFDDPNGTRARRMGIGLDSKISTNIYSGIEASERNLAVPVPSFSVKDQEFLQAQKEQLIRAYLYWTPHSYWVIRGELQLEKFTRDANDKTIAYDEPTRIQTLRAPFSIEYFHPTGFFSKFKTTFVEQDLTRIANEKDEVKRDSVVKKSEVDEFFLLDSVIGYRLPNRRGILSLEGRNLLNKEFFYRSINFYQSEAISPLFIPERTFFVRLTLNF